MTSGETGIFCERDSENCHFRGPRAICHEQTDPRSTPEFTMNSGNPRPVNHRAVFSSTVRRWCFVLLTRRVIEFVGGRVGVLIVYRYTHAHTLTHRRTHTHTHSSPARPFRKSLPYDSSTRYIYYYYIVIIQHETVADPHHQGIVNRHHHHRHHRRRRRLNCCCSSRASSLQELF